MKIIIQSLQPLQVVSGQLIDFKSGDKDNAIPRSALVTLALSPTDIVVLEKFLADKQGELQKTLTAVDSGLTLSLQLPKVSTRKAVNALHERSSKALLRLINALHHGPLKFSDEVCG